MTGQWIPLKDLARVSLGFKSLQNDFFYVNQETIDTYSIESDFLLPILMLGDMTSSSFTQSPSTQYFLFTCNDAENTLRGTGALRYIRTMGTKAASKKKQSGTPQTIQEVLEKQGGGRWYAPKAAPTRAHIWLRKAFGDVYSPFLFRNPVLVDQRCNRVEPMRGLHWETLASYLSSTVFSLTVEVNGAAGLGGGALEAATTKLAEVPVPNLRAWDEQEIVSLRRLGKKLWEETSPFAWRATRKVPRALIELDEFILRKVGADVSAVRMYEDLRETCGTRYRLAEDKRQGAKQKTSADIGSVARSIAESVQALIDARRFPEDFHETEGATELITLPDSANLRVSMHPMLGNSDLVVSTETGMSVYEFTGATEVVELIEQAILSGRREFQVSNDRKAAQDALGEYLPWIRKIRESIKAATQSSALGTGYEQVLEERVFRLLRMDPQVGLSNLPSEFTVARVDG